MAPLQPLPFRALDRMGDNRSLLAMVAQATAGENDPYAVFSTAHLDESVLASAIGDAQAAGTFTPPAQQNRVPRVLVHLSGMMGSGKTTLGGMIARHCNSVVPGTVVVKDTDEFIQPADSAWAGLQQILRDDGEAAFVHAWRAFIVEQGRNFLAAIPPWVKVVVFTGLLNHGNVVNNEQVSIDEWGAQVDAVVRVWVDTPIHVQLSRYYGRVVEHGNQDPEIWSQRARPSASLDSVVGSADFVDESLRMRHSHLVHDKYSPIAEPGVIVALVEKLSRV